MGIRLLLLIICLLAGNAFATGVAVVEPVSIEVRHLPKQAGWDIRYRLSAPVDRLQFFGPFAARRRDRWHIVTPGLEWSTAKDEGGQPHDAIVSSTGALLRTVTLHFDSDLTKLEKTYPLNQRFSDGSEWLYTGHLYAAPVRLHQPERETHMHLHLVPARGESISLLGRRHAKPTDWTERDAQLRGAFVYFGNLPSVETPEASIIADPALPRYLHELFVETYPQLLHYYTAKTGFALKQRPTVTIVYSPESDLGVLNSQGDALPDSFNLSFTDNAWADEKPSSRLQAIEFIAHESAHLWNGNRFDSVEGDDAPWMHEGGADAFAWLAMRHSGLLDDEGLRLKVEHALNRCLADLGSDGTSLQLAFEHQRYSLGYSCGAVMNLLVDLELRDRGGLFAQWHALFESAEKTGDRYRVEQYFTTLDRLAGDDRLSILLRQLWTGPLPDPTATFRSALTMESVESHDGTPPADEVAAYPVKAMATLMCSHCGSSVNFRNERDGFLVGGMPMCTAFKSPLIRDLGPGSRPEPAEGEIEYRVTALAGQPVHGDGKALYEAVAAACVEGKPIDATLANGESLALACKKPLPPLPAYLHLTNWPDDPS